MKLRVNGTEREVRSHPETPLLWVLRDELGLTGTKFGCGAGLCGACTVHVGGAAAPSCVLPVRAVTGAVTTIEGLVEGLTGPNGAALVEAWVAHQVAQCGYCQPGQIMAAAALLGETPDPTDADIDAAMAGNLCRCGTYGRIRLAIHAAAHRIRES